MIEESSASHRGEALWWRMALSYEINLWPTAELVHCRHHLLLVVRARWTELGGATGIGPPAANPEQSFIRTGYSEQQEGSTAVLMAERALGDAQGRHAIARTPRARIGQLSTWSLGCGFDSAGPP